MDCTFVITIIQQNPFLLVYFRFFLKPVETFGEILEKAILS